MVVDDSADVRFLLRAIPDIAGDLKLCCAARWSTTRCASGPRRRIAACVGKDDMDEIPRLALSLARGSAP
jgi:hypothetical protein